MTTQYVREPGLETVQVDENWIILNTDDYTVTKLNDVGGYCWGLLQVPYSLEALAAKVRADYDSAGEAVQEELERFLAELTRLGLVRHAG